jgi:DNA-binding response OmpR family regulator
VKAQKHIHLIDDEASVRSYLRTLLQREGYRVTDSDNPLSVQLRDESSPPDLVIVDLSMPGLDGYEVCREYKREGAAPVRVLVLTGHTDLKTRAAVRDAGADAFLTKPVDKKKLLKTIASLVRH